MFREYDKQCNRQGRRSDEIATTSLISTLLGVCDTLSVDWVAV